MSGKTWFCSIDIGKKNFAFCIEEFDKKELLKIKNIPSTRRYNSDGTPTEAMEEILEQVYSNGKIVLHKNLNLTKNCDPKKKLDPETFHNMTEVLDEYSEYWEKCSTIIIEQQMAFGRKVNMMAIKLAQHCYSYFCIKYGGMKKVIDFPAYHKTEVLGAEKVEGKPYKSGKIRYKAMEKPQRKKWSVNKTIEILTSRGELDILDELTSVSKKDDLADCFLQLLAAKYLIFIDKKEM